MDYTTLLGVLLTWHTYCRGENIVLRQKSGSTDQNSLRWTPSPCPIPSRWRRERNQKTSSDTWNTCTSRTPTSIPCSLVTEEWELPRGVNTIYLNVGGTLTNCTQILRFAGYEKCSPSFSVDASGEDGTFESYANAPMRTFKAWSVQRAMEIEKYNDTIPIPVSGFTRVTLKFTTMYWCGDISHAHVFYIACPARSSQLVEFDPQPAPPASQMHTVVGRCAENAVRSGSESLEMTCLWNGTTTVQGKCICKAGYEKRGLECTGKSVTIKKRPFTNLSGTYF